MCRTGPVWPNGSITNPGPQQVLMMIRDCFSWDDRVRSGNNSEQVDMKSRFSSSIKISTDRIQASEDTRPEQAPTEEFQYSQVEGRRDDPHGHHNNTESR